MRRFTVFALALTVAGACVGTGILAADTVNTNVALGPGQSATVTCSGDHLSTAANGHLGRTLICTSTPSIVGRPSVGSGSTTTTSTTTTSTTEPALPPPSNTVAPLGPTQGSSWWIPSTAPTEWQWELDHPLDVTDATDLGLDDTASNGDTPPATDPTVYDIDAFDNPASTVAALHTLGDRVVCYIEVGTAGNYYTAAEEEQSQTYYAQLQADGDLGAAQQGWPEYYLNVNAPSTLQIIESMISDCAAKGFDAVETDNDETWQYDTGFSLTEADVEAYLTQVANYIHSLGMAWFIKNPDDVGNPSFSDAMYPLADAAITEQCNQYDTCSIWAISSGTRPSSTLSTHRRAPAPSALPTIPLASMARCSTRTSMARRECLASDVLRSIATWYRRKNDGAKFGDPSRIVHLRVT